MAWARDTAILLPGQLSRSSDARGVNWRTKWLGKAELEVQNTGSKSIDSIYWEFFLIVEANSYQETRSYQIQSKKAIRPGQSMKVTGWIKDTYLKELREQLKKGLLQGRAEIKRIDYAGGRIWLPLKVKPKQAN